MAKSNPAIEQLLDVEYIRKQMFECFKYIEKTKGRDIFLVLGNMDVGKSTTCNYLSGCQMKTIIYKNIRVVETTEETNIKIGHEFKYETLCAQTVLIDGVSSACCNGSKNSICLLDCPAFSGIETDEEKVIEFISTELAIRNARQIGGIVILMSFGSIVGKEIAEFHQLVKMLISLFKDPVKIVQYSTFVITKNNTAKNLPKKSVIASLNAIKEYCVKQCDRLRMNPILRLDEMLMPLDLERIEVYISAVLQKPEDILFIDPLDDGESRKLILDRIQSFDPFSETNLSEKIQPLTINDFKFSKYDENRFKLKQIMYDIADESDTLINYIQCFKEKSEILHLKISSHQAMLSNFTDLRDSLSEDINKADRDSSWYLKEDFQSSKVLESIIDENKKRIEVVENEILENDVWKGSLSTELEKLNTDDSMIFIKKEITKNPRRRKSFCMEEMEISANTGDTSIEIIDVIKTKENGEWWNKVDNRGKGIYKIKYASERGNLHVEASVTTYIKAKDEAGNRKRIRKLNNMIVQLCEEENKLKSEIRSVNSHNETLQSTIKEAKTRKEDYRNSLNQRLKECEKDIDCQNCRIVELQQERKSALISGLTYLNEFDENRHKFDIVASIVAILKKFESSKENSEDKSLVITGFIDRLNTFLLNLKNFRNFFETHKRLCIN